MEPTTVEDFPDITLCNLNPFANTPYGVQEINKLFHVMNNIYNPAIQAYLGDHTYNIFDVPQYQNLLRPGKMLEFLAKTLPESGYEETRNFLLNCQWDTDIPNYNCMGNAKIRLHNTDFGYCFTFSRPLNSTTVAGFSAILYLDSFSFVTHMPAFPVGLGNVFTNGARVVLHPPHTQPVLTDGFNVEAGDHTTLVVELKRIEKLGPPYSDCQHEPNINQCWPDIPTPSNVRYGKKQCEDYCFQQLIRNNCGCVSGSKLSIHAMRHNYTFCGDQIAGDPREIIVNVNAMLECFDSIPETECPNPCVEEIYDIKLYRSHWPHAAYQMSFYNEYIKNQPYSQDFAVYENISRMTDKAEAFERLSSVDLIRSNFLQVNVIWRESSLTVLREHEALGVEALIGNLGGMLNLWVGISFVTAIELVEMCINCLGCLKADRRKVDTVRHRKRHPTRVAVVDIENDMWL